MQTGDIMRRRVLQLRRLTRDLNLHSGDGKFGPRPSRLTTIARSLSHGGWGPELAPTFAAQASEVPRRGREGVGHDVHPEPRRKHRAGGDLEGSALEVPLRPGGRGRRGPVVERHDCTGDGAGQHEGDDVGARWVVRSGRQYEARCHRPCSTRGGALQLKGTDGQPGRGGGGTAGRVVARGEERAADREVAGAIAKGGRLFEQWAVERDVVAVDDGEDTGARLSHEVASELHPERQLA